MTATESTQNEIESLDAALADLVINEVTEDEDDIVDETDVIVEGDEDVLADLDMAEETGGESEEIDDDALADLDIALQKQEIYQEQVAQSSVSVDPDTVKPKAKTGKKSRNATPKPRIQRDLSAVDAKHFVLNGDASTMSEAQLDAVKATVISMKPSQVKIAEKFENLFVSMAAGRLPSAYTVNAFKLLDKKGNVTSADLVAMFKADGLSEGTARSQTGQLMTLLACVQVAKRDKNTLELMKDSAVAERLRDLIASASAP